MKKIFFLILLIIPIKVKAIDISASSAILMDMDSKRVLYSKKINDVRSVASISKVMTALIAIEKGDLKKNIIVSDEIDKAYGSGIYIKKGEELTIEDLLYGLMLRSGNDASYSIAKSVGGDISNFVKMMNDKTKELKLKNTIFNNPNGLDEEKGNYSTAYDMAIIMSEAMKYDAFKKIVSTKKYKLTTNKNTYIWHNKNKTLTNYKYATGGKTGYTKKAKRTLINTASKDNLNLVVVTLNDGNDFKDHESLFEYGFSNYKNYQILKKGNIDIIGEEYYKNYKFYIKNDFNYPLTDEEKDYIVLKFDLKKLRKFKNNDYIGDVKIFLYDKEIHKEKIYIKKNEIKKGWVSRLW